MVRYPYSCRDACDPAPDGVSDASKCPTRVDEGVQAEHYPARKNTDRVIGRKRQEATVLASSER